jgi:hypothetical protein
MSLSQTGTGFGRTPIKKQFFSKIIGTTAGLDGSFRSSIPIKNEVSRFL